MPGNLLEHRPDQRHIGEILDREQPGPEPVVDIVIVVGDVIGERGDLRLGAGMYPEVQWPVRRPQPSLLVPPTSIVTTTERTFVIRVNNGVAQWVNVGRGARVGDLIEVFGALKEGDTIVRRGTDEIREGAKVNVQPAKAS